MAKAGFRPCHFSGVCCSSSENTNRPCSSLYILTQPESRGKRQNSVVTLSLPYTLCKTQTVIGQLLSIFSPLTFLCLFICHCQIKTGLEQWYYTGFLGYYIVFGVNPKGFHLKILVKKFIII